MKLKHYIFFSIIIILTSAASALGGFSYGTLITKQKAEMDKEAAVKGAIFDAQEKLNQEALKKAEEVVGEVTDKSSTDAKKVLEEFFKLLESKNNEGAYKFLTADYKKSIFSANGINKIFSNAKSIKLKLVEFRSSGDNSAMFSVSLEATATSKEPVYFVSLTKDISGVWNIDNIELKDKTQNFNASYGTR